MEREIKTFFNKVNRLNKGYQAIEEVTQSENINLKKKIEKLLPPLDVVTEYESMYPGTISRILDLAEKEQCHKHQQDNEKNNTTKSRMIIKSKAIFTLNFFALLVSLLLTNILISNKYINLLTNAFIFILLVVFVVYYNFKDRLTPSVSNTKEHKVETNVFNKQSNYQKHNKKRTNFNHQRTTRS